MGKRLCLTFSVYYFVHPYNITALMICQHVFLNIYIFLQKALYSPYCTSNISCIFVEYYKGFSTIHNDTASSWNGRLTNHYIHSFFSDVHFQVYLFYRFRTLYCTFYTHTSDKLTCSTSVTEFLIQLY